MQLDPLSSNRWAPSSFAEASIKPCQMKFDCNFSRSQHRKAGGSFTSELRRQDKAKDSFEKVKVVHLRSLYVLH